MNKFVLQLAGLLACVALATSRLGLVAHELVGHGGAATLLGGHVTEVRLFWFAGGWIRYTEVSSTAAALAIAMGGIAVELVAGTALWLAVRGDTLGRRILRGIGAAIVLHGAWYLATGAFNGFGDGQLLYHLLGAARVPVAIAAGGIVCLAAYAGAREVLGALAATLPARRVLGTIIALALAGGLHAALTLGELRLRRDTTYVAIMQPERERVVARELAQWTAAHPESAPGEQQAERTRLEEEHREFPFVWVLGVATALAIAAGARRAKPAPPTLISRRLLASWAIAAGVALALVIAL